MMTHTLYARIFLPFCLSVAIATAVAWFAATYLFATILESRLSSQLDHAAVLVAEKAFPITEDLLLRLAELQQFELILFDRAGRLGLDLGVYGVPDTFVIDRGGVIRYKQVGPITEEALQSVILPMLERLASEP